MYTNNIIPEVICYCNVFVMVITTLSPLTVQLPFPQNSTFP